jgi:SAM-dependent methyltransferase
MPEHYLLRRYSRMLAARGWTLTETSKILDFGCGAGSYVRAFREEGYDVRGFEPFGGIAPSDDPAFSSLDWPSPYKVENYRRRHLPDLTIDWKRDFRLPYPDATFDFVFSTEVMEHISDHDAVLAELSRVMKPDAMAIHSFPARYRLMEPHVLVPLGGVLKFAAWYRAWLAIWPPKANPWLAGLSGKETARMSLWYARGSLHYPTLKQLRRIADRYFERSTFVPLAWEEGSAKIRFVFPWLYSRTQNVIWMLERPTYRPETHPPNYPQPPPRPSSTSWGFRKPQRPR